MDCILPKYPRHERKGKTKHYRRVDETKAKCNAGPRLDPGTDKAISGKAGEVHKSVVLYQLQLLSWDHFTTVTKVITIKGNWVKGIQELANFLIGNFIEIIVDSRVVVKT